MKRVVSTGTGAVSCCAVVTEISAEVQISQALQKSAHDLQRVSHQVLTAQESERQRIAADLHDGLGQLLGAVKFGLESVLGSADTHGRQEARATLSSVASTVKEALEEVRRLAMNLRPSTLDDLGLLATLSWFVREFQGVYRSIAVETDFRIDESDVEDGLKVAIFRVVQEAMNNIAKHSRATRARICLERDGAGLRMTVEDNGVGFSQADVASRQGVEKRHGHACSRDRVEWSGGTYSVDAAPGRGVRIKVSWPSARNAVTGPSQGTDNATTLAHHDRRGPHAAADRIAGAAEPGRRT
jgi:signal transduction histidine kinase